MLKVIIITLIVLGILGVIIEEVGLWGFMIGLFGVFCGFFAIYSILIGHILRGFIFFIIMIILFSMAKEFNK